MQQRRLQRINICKGNILGPCDNTPVWNMLKGANIVNATHSHMEWTDQNHRSRKCANQRWRSNAAMQSDFTQSHLNSIVWNDSMVNLLFVGQLQSESCSSYDWRQSVPSATVYRIGQCHADVHVVMQTQIFYRCLATSNRLRTCWSYIDFCF